MSDVGQAGLIAESLVVTRGGRDIVRGVTLKVEPGEVVGVLGPSGAGKSTLFRALVGELAVARGAVRLGSTDLTPMPVWARARAGVGYIPQTPSVFWDLTVEENLVAYAKIAHGAVDGARIKALLEEVELDSQRSVRAGELSGGERRRLEFARAITKTPKVLICDEPFAGVDPSLAARLGALLDGLAKKGVGVVLADHHVAEALHICTRAILLLDGEVAAEADPETFRSLPIVQGRYLGNAHELAPRHTS